MVQVLTLVSATSQIVLDWCRPKGYGVQLPVKTLREIKVWFLKLKTLTD